ncbi:unnamed protein product [Onchocerca flexuosa]|uniref:Uncharacterized protein n=1 Tax=Onchocerca flexuosa TaxID=387005 RepID=A0A183HNU7_9BILA|nr:unnamed protein product [Onchocerca flexuosa]
MQLSKLMFLVQGNIHFPLTSMFTKCSQLH